MPDVRNGLLQIGGSSTTLFPRLSFSGDETPLSWATRLAAFHTGGRLIPFLNDLGIAVQDLVSGRAGAIDRLCTVAGQDPAPVFHNAAQITGQRRYHLRGEPISAEFLHSPLTAFCPCCLLEDDSAGPDAAVQRRGRLIWMLRPVRTCPTHGVPLIFRPREGWNDMTHELAIRVPERGPELERLVEGLEARQTVSRLQAYTVDRLERRAGPAWLDRQGIEQAIRATEMLGVVLEFGPAPNLKALAPQDWDRAGRAGYAYTSQGPDGVRQAFQDIHSGHTYRNGNPGPKRIFGRLYEWLEFGTSSKDPGPIKDLLRAHIFDTMAVPAGKPVLGEALPLRRWHSVGSLARESGVHPKTLHNMLVAEGFVATTTNGSLDGYPTIPAKEGERVADAIKRAIPAKLLPEAIGCTRAQAEQLVRTGILRPLVGEVSEKKGRFRCAVDRKDVDDLLASLARRTTPVAQPPGGMYPIAKAAEKCRRTSADILRDILEDTGAQVFQVRTIHGIAGLHVNPSDFMDHDAPPPVGLGLSEAFQRLGVPHKVGQALVADREEGALLRTTRIAAPSAGRKDMVRVLEEDLAAFRSVYATHGHLCQETGLHHRQVTTRLALIGVSLAHDPEDIGTRLYRRSDLPEGWAG